MKKCRARISDDVGSSATSPTINERVFYTNKTRNIALSNRIGLTYKYHCTI